MALISIRRDPTRKDIIVFGILLTVFVAILGGFLWLQTESLPAAIWVWLLGGTICAGYAIIPAIRRPIFIFWSLVTFPIGLIITTILLAVIYYGLLTPLGLAARLVRGDPLQRRHQPAADSYWTERPESDSVDRYFRQF